MITSYVVYDDKNRRMETFAGPCRLARWNGIPKGWSIERFLGTISQGIVSFADVAAHAFELGVPANAVACNTISDEEMDMREYR